MELEAFEGVPAKTRVPRLDLNMLIKFHALTQRANKQCIQIFSSFLRAQQCFVLHNEYLKFCDLDSTKVDVQSVHLRNKRNAASSTNIVAQNKNTK